MKIYLQKMTRFSLKMTKNCLVEKKLRWQMMLDKEHWIEHDCKYTPRRSLISLSARLTFNSGKRATDNAAKLKCSHTYLLRIPKTFAFALRARWLLLQRTFTFGFFYPQTRVHKKNLASTKIWLIFYFAIIF